MVFIPVFLRLAGAATPPPAIRATRARLARAPYIPAEPCVLRARELCLCRRQQLAQYVRQDAAVFQVIHFNAGVDAQRQRDTLR